MKISNKEDEQCKIYKLNRTLEKCSISKKENGEIAISGRELHQALEVKTAYKDWFQECSNTVLKKIQIIQLSLKRATAQGNMTHYIDHALTLDTAKEIAMIQRSEPGKRRQYFIQVEKRGIVQK